MNKSMRHNGMWVVAGTMAMLISVAGAHGQEGVPPAAGQGVEGAPPAEMPALEREVHVLRVEFLGGPGPAEARGPVSVMVDGEMLPSEQAKFMMDLITHLRGAVFAPLAGPSGDRPLVERWRDRRNGDGGQEQGRPMVRGERRDDGFGDWAGDSGPGRNWFAPDMGLDDQGQPALDQETIKNILIVIGDVNPTLQTQLIDLRTSDQSLFEQRMRESARQWRELILLRGTDPEGYKVAVENAQLTQRRMELMRAWFEAGKAGDEARKEQIKGQLRDVLGRQFDNRNARSQQEVARLEEQLKRLKESLADRASKRDAVIDKQLDMLTSGPRRQPMTPRAGETNQGPSPEGGAESGAARGGGGG